MEIPIPIHTPHIPRRISKWHREHSSTHIHTPHIQWRVFSGEQSPTHIHTPHIQWRVFSGEQSPTHHTYRGECLVENSHPHTSTPTVENVRVVEKLSLLVWLLQLSTTVEEFCPHDPPTCIALCSCGSSSIELYRKNKQTAHCVYCTTYRTSLVPRPSRAWERG